MSKVLCVCYGNTCRSPMFAALLQQSYAADRRSDIIVESAGLNREAAGQTAATEWETLREMTGVDLSQHRSRCIDDLNVEQYDKIICLDEKVYQQLLAKGWSPLRVKLADIPNPWQKGLQAYRDCYTTIKELVKEF